MKRAFVQIIWMHYTHTDSFEITRCDPWLKNCLTRVVICFNRFYLIKLSFPNHTAWNGAD